MSKSWIKKIFTGPKTSKEIKELKEANAKLQQSLTLTLSQLETKDDDYKGNPYQSYKAITEELSDKYKGIADWGNQQADNIISTRGTFIIGSGLTIKTNEDAKDKDKEFVEDLFKKNKLNSYLPIELAKEAEIEGKSLIRLIPDEEDQNIDIRHISWTQHGYKVITDGDYLSYEKARYKKNGKRENVVLNEKEFVYRKFGGRLSEVNKPTPKLGKVLPNFERLDKALWDLRKINHYFASPTPVVECETAEQANKMHKKLQDANWKIGKLLVITGSYKLEGLSGTGVDSILDEIKTNAQIISGQSGVPIHFLGFADLLSNRATADALIEALESSTQKDRDTWKSAYNEVINKAMRMANEEFQAGYTPGSVEVDIPFVTKGKMKELVDVWLPLYMGDVITLSDMLSKVPEIDSEKTEADLKEQRQQEALDFVNRGDEHNDE